MTMNKETLSMVQAHLGYTDEEMALFMENPRNADVLSKAPALMDKTIVVEVVEASGCNSGHRKGDRFIFDGAGNLLTRLNPKRICCFDTGIRCGGWGHIVMEIRGKTGKRPEKLKHEEA